VRGALGERIRVNLSVSASAAPSGL
jgi:hypothetical protein